MPKGKIPNRKTHEVNMGIEIQGWDRCIVLSDLFRRYFNPKDGIYDIQTPAIRLGFTHHRTSPKSPLDGIWNVWVYFEYHRPPNRDYEDRMRTFIHASIATIYHYNPIKE